jgi:hypothetical protein
MKYSTVCAFCISTTRQGQVSILLEDCNENARDWFRADQKRYSAMTYPLTLKKIGILEGGSGDFFLLLLHDIFARLFVCWFMSMVIILSCSSFDIQGFSHWKCVFICCQCCFDEAETESAASSYPSEVSIPGTWRTIFTVNSDGTIIYFSRYSTYANFLRDMSEISWRFYFFFNASLTISCRDPENS